MTVVEQYLALGLSAPLSPPALNNAWEIRVGEYPVTFSPELLLKVRKIANIKSFVAEMLVDVYPGRSCSIAVIVHSSDYGGYDNGLPP